VARGKLIASMLCQGCHYDQNTNALTGHRMTDIPAEFGKIYSRNITQDPTYGIGTWSDGDIAYLLRTGVKPSGQYVPPYMVKLPHISDEDLYSIIAFLRSDDTLVRPMAVQDTDCEPSFLVKFLSRVAFKPFAYPIVAQVAPPISDQVAYGRYLVNDVVKCYECHSADFKSNDAEHPEKSVGYLGGGNGMLDPNGKTVYTPNLTMDKATGIGNWTEPQFVRAVREGFRPDNTALRFPMERHPELTEQEVAAIFSYLKTVPVLHNARKQSETIAQATIVKAAAPMDAAVAAGQKVYYKYACWSCHGETGNGACDLTKAGHKYSTDSSLTAWIRNPSEFQENSKMPTWNGVIKEDEYAPLCSYVRYLGAQAGNSGNLSMK
jgi:cytochrome c2